jgi:hypothetical protein
VGKAESAAAAEMVDQVRLEAAVALAALEARVVRERRWFLRPE